MDKTTQNDSILKQTLTAMVDNLCAGRLCILDEPIDDTINIAGQSYSPGRYPLHNHRYPEIVQACDKPAWLILGEEKIKLTPEQSYVIFPQTVHAERYYHRRSAYDLMWTVLGPESVSIFLSRYLPEETVCEMPEKLVSPSDKCRSIWELTSQTGLNDQPLKRAQLQSELIQLILEMIEKKQTPNPVNYNRHIIDQVQSYIDHHYKQDITVEELGQMVRCSPNHLNTVFRKAVGKPIHRYITDKRLSVACDLLKEKELLIKQIAYKVGFSDPLYFSRLFQRRFNQTPSQFVENK